jgi:anti-sigma factor RsiW
MADLSCRALVELVTEYLEGALSDGERVRFEAHLARCAGCEAYLEQVQATIALVAATGGQERQPGLEALLAELRRARRG